jgi:hypothetical protein
MPTCIRNQNAALSLKDGHPPEQPDLEGCPGQEVRFGRELEPLADRQVPDKATCHAGKRLQRR